MKILIIRHGDPDYAKDSLTEKGWREAEYLSERIAPMEVRQYYVSTMGRARDTASLTLKKAGRTAIECDWLREFAVGRVYRPDRMQVRGIPWDWLPEDWTSHKAFFDKDRWTEHELYTEAGIDRQYNYVITELDRLLASYGYVRDGALYRVEKANNDTIVFFCHFGLECVLLSHLLNISPVQLWHGTCAAPTSVTTVRTEERRKGTAYFRMSSFGDTTHLIMHNEPESLSARFCECYDNEGERID